jgi:hypothetical protein
LLRVKFHEATHIVGQLYRVPHETLQVFIIILYENVFQNPQLFRTQVSLSPKQSTLVLVVFGNYFVSSAFLKVTMHHNYYKY